MAVLGTWVNNRITRTVLATAGADGRALIKGLIEPIIQNILPDGTLPESSHTALDKLFAGTPLGRNIVSVKIWRKDQTVIYSSMSKEAVGKSFASTDVEKAFTGQIVAEFEDMISPESAYEQSLKMPLIEVYAPLYRQGTNEVIAVGEIYDDARELASELQASMWRTWLVVSVMTLVMLSVLYGIVRRASNTIAAQRAELDNRVIEAQRMAAQNAELRAIADKTRLEASEANEELLGRIGQDLHDGPVQLLSLLMLRLGQVGPKNSEDKRLKTVDSIRSLAQEIVRDLRNLSSGLVLPEIGNLTLAEAIGLAVDRHENLTGTKVVTAIEALPERNSDALKICVYRIVQESLTNSFRHAGGAGQHVNAREVDGAIKLTISDTGPGFSRETLLAGKRERLGLRGISNRVLAFGGGVTVEPRPGGGTLVIVTLPVEK
jgi:signal transduction histidine kinase